MMDDTFASQPPHWNSNLIFLSTSELREIIAGYDTLDAIFQSVIPCLLASTILHATWIMVNYPSQHPLFNTRFWTNDYHIKYRQSIISSNYHDEVSRMKATGVSGLMRKIYF